MCSPTESNTAAFYVTHFPLWIMIQLDLLVRWAGLLSHHNRKLQSLFSIWLRPPRSGDLGMIIQVQGKKMKEENTPGSETNTPNEPGLTGCSYDNMHIKCRLWVLSFVFNKTQINVIITMKLHFCYCRQPALLLYSTIVEPNNWNPNHYILPNSSQFPFLHTTQTISSCGFSSTSLRNMF